MPPFTRLLQRRPGFTLLAALLLALGIGANSAIFSAVHAILLSPFPFTAPERLVILWKKQPQLNAARGSRATLRPSDLEVPSHWHDG